MKITKPEFQQLSVTAIEQSPQIQEWLSQFSNGQQATAKTLLSRLKFVSRDTYSSWLHQAIEQLPPGETYALYSVRKLDKNQTCYWDFDGNPVIRPGTSQGSEDLVYSLVSNLVRSNKNKLLDHPSLLILKNNKVRNFILIDDSIGSGKRVSDFINAMLKHPTFLSWWNFGWVRISILCFARPKESETNIINKIIGSDHGIRKYRKSSKINFTSSLVYEKNWLETRWGTNEKEIKTLCYNQKKVPKNRRLGFGEVFSNIVFYHSVPNNIPGILWFVNPKWQGLMPGRALPDWLRTLLEHGVINSSDNPSPLSAEILNLLTIVKRGVRSTSSIALRLNVDYRYADKLITLLISLGLLTSQVRLTATGLDKLKQSNQTKTLSSWDYSCYIPSSWCAGQKTIQPLSNETFNDHWLTESVEPSVSMDGDVGEASLERSDAKATTSPFRVIPQSPSESRKMYDTDGPLGSKDR